jgi:phosphoribosylformylglycinamidine cyclo-ligase
VGENQDAYQQAGVDIEAGLRAVRMIREDARSTFGPQVLTDLGHFGGLFALGRYNDPVLVSSADGVGTKLLIAIAANRHNTIGIDLVNHCVNDILTTGAIPLFFLDYFSTGKLIPERLAEVVSGLAQACRETGTALIGGETAEMPSLYSEGDYDLAGFIVGAVERDKVITGQKIIEGDVLIGLPSTGLQTNGYSLARKVFLLDQMKREDMHKRLEMYYQKLGCTLQDELLKPHGCFLPVIKPLLGTGKIKGMAHITGGGLMDNVPRILPEDLGIRVRQGTWKVLPIFGLIQDMGQIDIKEMFHVFNMGVGFVVICSPNDAAELLAQMPGGSVIGDVVRAENDQRFELV